MQDEVERSQAVVQNESPAFVSVSRCRDGSWLG